MPLHNQSAKKTKNGDPFLSRRLNSLAGLVRAVFDVKFNYKIAPN
jgi:hypothetical protein